MSTRKSAISNVIVKCGGNAPDFLRVAKNPTLSNEGSKNQKGLQAEACNPFDFLAEFGCGGRI
ncbi:MAG: hypothetical protein HHJ09_12905 [Glaciimonas sp.]|nr:hypothetical protein [Glaciimonas sp.]